MGRRVREPGDEVAVVIPARNEEGRIGSCLSSLGPFLEAGDPVVVVDAGSEDSTADRAAAAGAQVIRARGPQRGLALWTGYREAEPRADVVFLVHADMVVPATARDRILGAMATRPDAVGGALGHRIDDPGARFRWIERGNAFRARHLQLPYGDQAQFVRVAVVRKAGGFPRLPEMEDLELSLRLRRHGPWLYLDLPVTIPDRHWRRGVVRQTLTNWTRAVRYLHGGAKSVDGEPDGTEQVPRRPEDRHVPGRASGREGGSGGEAL